MKDPNASRAYRRNIIALGGIVSMAGFAGANPGELSIFGVALPGQGGVTVLGLGVMLTQLYWFAVRYHSLREVGVIEMDPSNSTSSTARLSELSEGFRRVRKTADLISNHIAVILTATSWYLVYMWVCSWHPASYQHSALDMALVDQPSDQFFLRPVVLYSVAGT